MNSHQRALRGGPSQHSERKLAEDEQQPNRDVETPTEGKILAALRRSPLAELDLTREHGPGRKIEL